MNTNLASLVESATSILILLPIKPYFDQVAAGLSLYLSLKDLPAGEAGKKEVAISASSPMMVGFNRIIGINKIVTEVGNKNLTIKFAGYDAGNIEKVSYDIENGEFRLTVVPKIGFNSPTKEQLDLSYAGVASDLVILIGGANDTHFPLLASEDVIGAKIVHIGTRVMASSKEVMSFAKPGSSTSELIANLIRENGFSIDADTATNLVMGIEEGSNNFGNSEVTPETFETFAHLLRSGGVRSLKTKLSPTSFPAGSIPTQPFSAALQPKQDARQVMQQIETVSPDTEGTPEIEQDINAPDDWLQPKVYKGASSNQPDSYSENKG